MKTEAVSGTKRLQPAVVAVIASALVEAGKTKTGTDSYLIQLHIQVKHPHLLPVNEWFQVIPISPYFQSELSW